MSARDLELQELTDWQRRYYAQKTRAEAAEAERDWALSAATAAQSDARRGVAESELGKAIYTIKSANHERATLAKRLAQTQAVVREVVERMEARPTDVSAAIVTAWMDRLRALLPESEF